MFGKGPAPSKGWTVANGRLEEVSTVIGYAERRCELHGRCHRRDCRRTCHFDYEQLLKAGLGSVSARQVMKTFQCSRLDGCGLYFDERPDRRLTLGDLTGRDYVAAEIRCGGCRAVHVTSVEGLIARLKASGQGGPESDLKAVGDLIRTPCAKCKAVSWKIEILWFDPAGRVPLWKQALDKRRDASRQRREAETFGPVQR